MVPSTYVHPIHGASAHPVCETASPQSLLSACGRLVALCSPGAGAPAARRPSTILEDSAASLACERAGLTCTFAPRYVILRLSLHLSLARRSTAPDGAPPLRTCHLQWLPTLRRQCRHARLASGPPLPCPRIAAATGFFSRRRRRPCSSSTAACTSPSWSRRRSRTGYVADTSVKMRLRCKCCTTAPGINFHNAIPHTVTLQYVSLLNKLQIQMDVAMGN